MAATMAKQTPYRMTSMNAVVRGITWVGSDVTTAPNGSHAAQSRRVAARSRRNRLHARLFEVVIDGHDCDGIPLMSLSSDCSDTPLPTAETNWIRTAAHLLIALVAVRIVARALPVVGSVP